VNFQHLNKADGRPCRVVVTGASGFVGNAVATRLEQDAIPVLRLARRDVDLLSVNAADLLSACLRAGDVLVASAAIAPCTSAEKLRDNVNMALSMIRAAEQVELSHIVNISSDAVYADSDEPLTERSVTSPETLHGIMHLTREVMFRTAFRENLVCLRPTLIYGAGDTHNGYGPNRFRRQAAVGAPIVLFGEGEERRDHILINDVAEIVARVILRRSIGTLNIASGVVTSFRDIANLVVRLSGRQVLVTGSPREGPMPHNGFRPFDVKACRDAFPDFSCVPLIEGLAISQREDRECPA
jgi:nucleoside-diphosphate-sugar epimerase